MARFEEKNRTIEQLDVQLKKLHQSTEALVEYRKSLAGATLALSKSLGNMSESEENERLSAAIAGLSKVQEKVASVHNDQAAAEFFQLSELIKDYIGLVGAVRDVFHVRARTNQDDRVSTKFTD